MAGMLNLRNVLELVNHRFDDRSSAQQQLITQPHQTVFHVRFELGDQLDARVLPELESKFLRNIASVAKHLAKELLEKLGHRLPLIGITGSQLDVEEFSSLIDDQMQLETKEPVD